MRIALTSGEPAGIGPDIALSLATVPLPLALTVIGDIHFLKQRAALLKLDVELYQDPHSTGLHTGDGKLCVHHIPLPTKVQAGVADTRCAQHVLQQIDYAIDGNLHRTFDGMVTAPINKAVINRAGIPFTGHTEYLAQRCAVPTVMMLTDSRPLRVALVTTHLPLREVPTAITADRFASAVTILHKGLRNYCGLTHPTIGICGLNPHAGEQGYLGDEEINILQPTIKRLVKQGLKLSGPFPADTIFTDAQAVKFDAILAMFHDQGLPVIKHAGFGEVINVTFGLPFLRTSVDHGTAFELAGSGTAANSSLIAAVRWTQQALSNANKQ